MAASRALISLVLVASCALAAAAPATVVSQKVYFQPLGRAIFGNTTSGPCSNATGRNYLDIDLAPGSGAFVLGDNIWTITDRGANLDCQGDAAPGGAAGVTLSKECQATNTACTGAGKVFPIPSFAPTIQRWKLPDLFTAPQPVPVETITLKKLNGQPINGFPNFDNQDTITNNPNRNLLVGESGYGPNFQKVGPDPFGMDTESIVVTSANADGTGATFWVSEEYGPSIAQVASDGKVLGRHVPAGVVYDAYMGRAGPALAANPSNGYPIYPTFPAILVKRDLNRGFENLAYFGKYIYTILQSPMANPTTAIGRQSLVARLFKLELDASAPGGARLIGEYVYFCEKVSTFPQDASANQNNIKLGEATAIQEDILLVDEHVTLQTKLFRIDLRGATNILGSKWDDITTSPTLEAIELANSTTSGSALAANGIVPVKKLLAFDSFTDNPPSSGQPQLPVKIEGTGVYGEPFNPITPAQLILINDNDFGIAGDLTRFTLFNVAPSTYRGPVLCPQVSNYSQAATCDPFSSIPNQCFNSDSSLYTCCSGLCGSAGATPSCATVPASCTGTNAPTATPTGTTRAPTSAPTGIPASTPSTPTPTATPTPTFAVGSGTCDPSGSLPNPCFAANGMTYTCCPRGQSCGPSADRPTCV